MANEKRLIDANAPMVKEYFNPRLIDYREFVKECNHFYENPPFPHPATPWHKGLQLAVEIAMRLKPVDAVEVVHGRWVKKTADYVYYYACSECGEPVLKSQWGHDFFSNYCPNCGADMRERKDNDR